VNEPILVEEWHQEKRFKPFAYVREQGIVSSASVVIPGLKQPYGVLGAHSQQRHSFTGDDVSFFQAVANLLAVAIGRKQFETQLKALNETLEERVERRTTQVRSLASELLFVEQRVRQHIAQVLHDDLQQLLFAAQIHLRFVTQGLAPAEQAPLLAEIEQAKSVIEGALRLTRRLTLDLSPPVLEDQDLGESLQWLVNHMKELYGLEVELKMAEIPAIPSEDIPPLLFQIVRELLFNIVKHAGVKQAQVRVLAKGDDLAVQVIDEGTGFDPAAGQEPAHDGGYGLRRMSERLGLFSGRLDIVSQPGKGTTVTVIIPQREGEPSLV
jgi:signal transduction histidine kinase